MLFSNKFIFVLNTFWGLVANKNFLLVILGFRTLYGLLNIFFSENGILGRLYNPLQCSNFLKRVMIDTKVHHFIFWKKKLNKWISLIMLNFIYQSNTLNIPTLQQIQVRSKSLQVIHREPNSNFDYVFIMDLINLLMTIILQTTSTISNPEVEDEQLCCEALEVMTLCFALIPTALDSLTKEKSWQSFVIDLLLYCPSK